MTWQGVLMHVSARTKNCSECHPAAGYQWLERLPLHAGRNESARSQTEPAT